MSDKQPSGAQNRKRARLAKEASRKVKLPVSDFRALPFPDLNDLNDGLVYARNCGLVALHQIVNTSNDELDPLTRWKLIKDFIATLGMTWQRSSAEAKLKKLTEARSANADPAGGMERFDAVAGPATPGGT